MAQDIDDNYADAGDLVSIEIFQGITNALNELIDSVPAGEIAAILVFGSLNVPDPTIWQECNGSEITDSLSPFRGHFTPDLRDRYLKGCAASGSVGLMGGSHTRNLQHNHGGATNEAGTGGTIVDASDGYWEARNHSHTISNDLGTAVDMQPRRFAVKHYLKIR